jgi:DNA-binding NtrC family response regulator
MERPTILVVDDELLIRDLLYDFFSGQGWNIAVAEDGEKALDLVRTRQIDLVLTDLKMPNMDGMTLSTELKENHPDMPIMVMTAYPSVDSAVQALRLKLDDYIVKPFNINQLYKTVEKTLKDKTKQQDAS